MSGAPVFEELERRILYSADLSPIALAGLDAGATHEQRLLQTAETSLATQVESEIAFVDMSLPDADKLIADLQAQAQAGRPIEVVRIAADEDGIARIGAALAGRSDIGAVHVLSHGSDGVVQLGSARLDAATLLARAGEVAGWGTALSESADLLLYGCDVAAGAGGEQLVAGLAALTGADVAASTDLTGAASSGGDWTLEASTGTVEAATALSAQAQGDYSHVLAIGIDATSKDHTTGATLTISHTTSGSDRLMLVGVSMADHGTRTVASITYGGVALTRVGTQASAFGEAYVEVWQLVAPATGSHDVVVTLSGANGGGTVAGVMTFTGVDQAAPLGAFASNAGSLLANPAATVPSGAGQIVFSTIAVRDGLLGGGLAPGAGQTERWDIAESNLTAGGSTEAGAPSVSASWSVPLLDTWALGAVSIRASTNTAPVITSNGGGANAALSVAENTTAATTVVASDAQTPGALTYSIAGGADAVRFTIDAASGALAFIAAPDFEAPADAGGNNVYDVVVRVSDGSLADTQAIAVAVSNANDNLPVIGSDGGGASASIVTAENSIAVTTVTASDADTGASLSYSIVGGADAAAFTINATSGVLNFVAAPDYEAPSDAGGDNVYDVVVQASDGTFSDVQAIAVGVADRNDNAPGIIVNSLAITEGQTGTPLITAVDPDNTPAQLVYTVSGLTGGRLELTSAAGVAVTSFTQADVDAGLLRFVSDGGEAAPAYRLSVSDGATGTAPQAANVSYTNVDDAPLITANSLAIGEGGSAAPVVTASDPDTPASQLVYSVSGVSGGQFERVGAPGAAIATFTQADIEASAVRFISDGGEAAPAYQLTLGDGTSIVGPQAASVSYTNINDAPVVAAIDLGAIGEDSSRLITSAELLAGASDAEGDVLSVLSLALVSGSGTLTDNGDGSWTFAPSADWNGAVAFAFDVSDGSALVPNSATLNVTAVDDAPVIAANGLTIAEGGTAMPAIAASDPDNAAAQLTFTVGLASGGRFELTTAPGNAVTSFTQADVDAGLLRFVSDGGEAAPAWRLSVGDGVATTGPQAGSVSYTNINDAPVLAAIDLGAIGEDTGRLITQGQLLAGASDAEGDALNALNLALVSGSGTLTDNGDGSWTFVPSADWNGAVGFAFDVSDGGVLVPNSASLAVTPVNDAPVITSNGGAPAATLAVAENATPVASLAASDVDNATSTLRFAIVGGADAARFTIDAASGALGFVATPDHEQATDANGDNRYEVIVGVSDGALAAQQVLSIDVGNVDEAPTIVANALLLSNGSATLLLTGTDPDTANAALVFQVSSTTGGQFELAATPGLAIGGFTQADLEAGAVRFVPDGSGGVPGYVLALSDGVSTVVSTATVTIAAAPAAPPVAPPVASPVAPGVAPVAAVGVAPGAAAAQPPAASPLPLAPTSAGRPAADPVLGTTESALPAEFTPLAVVSPGTAPAAPAHEPARDVFETGTASFSAARPFEPGATRRHDAEVQPSLAFELPSASVEQVDAGLSAADIDANASERSLTQAFERLRDELARTQQTDQELVASGALLSTGLSVGYVIWLARGGVLLASLMSSLPAWASIDPLPVLAQMKRREDGIAADADEVDPVEKLFGKAREWLSRRPRIVAREPGEQPA